MLDVLLIGVVALARLVGRDRATRGMAALARRLGPVLPRNRLAADNIAAAFPDHSRADHRRILDGAWTNFGRLIVEFFFFEELTSGHGANALTISGEERMRALGKGDSPSLIFTGHLANGDLLAAVGTNLGMRLTTLYRDATNPRIGARMKRRRAATGEWVSSDGAAALSLARALRRGRQVAISVDQRMAGAPVLPFLGRPAHCNDIVARLARSFDCPVHGIRSIRRPDGGFHVEFSEPLDLPRDDAGRIDVAATNAMIHAIIEGWVREHPDQYLWQHDRWRIVPES